MKMGNPIKPLGCNLNLAKGVGQVAKDKAGSVIASASLNSSLLNV
ncbi:hypothetical protein [Xylella fastidiosa]|nr:hypothetical protein [Xylella fastidiosa]